MEARQQSDEAVHERLPNTFTRGLDALNVHYPGCEKDLAIARETVELGSKTKFLKAYRKLLGKQIAYEHYHAVSGSNDMNTFDLDYPGNETDKRELEHWFNDNPPNEKNVQIFLERIEGLENKNAVFLGDRSHPHIEALAKLTLTYPGCEEDVQEALEIHYSRPFSIFPDTLHSLTVKQDMYIGDRSHWRLMKLDDLDLTYPKWQNDTKQIENWHVHNEDNRRNAVIFHEVIEGLLEEEDVYLGWNLEQRDPEESTIRTQDYETVIRQEAHEKKRRCGDSSSFDKYLYRIEKLEQKILKNKSRFKSRPKESKPDEDRREPKNEKYR